jgi:hypothetical protein
LLVVGEEPTWQETRSLTAFLVARGLRILQDFAGICRAILLKFFRVSTGWATHNP